ncbi:MAG: hypothetical protein P4L76_00255 [Beijerinckiaceae bacterium]|nr:hypothetical protein [Beijerinckiaceae bacterium]
MAGSAKPTWRLIISSLALGLIPHAGTAGDAPPSGLTIPISQTVMRDGTIRYSIWVKVGHRTVEAMLDTGSTGLRVLPPVVPGDLTGLPTEVTYENGVRLRGLSIPVGVEIGDLSGTVPVEVVDKTDCDATEANCPVPKHGTYLIGGDGLSGHGYSAILGIGFSERSTDVPNPLEVLGATQWMVELPSPDEPSATGRLVLKPDADAQAGFKMAPAVKGGDFFGCLQTKKPEQMICGPLLLDTGAPNIMAVTQDAETGEIWPRGRPANFRFRSGQTLSFDSGGAGDMSQVRIVPAKQRPKLGDSFILAGLFPYYFYDVLYDAAAHKVGLRERDRPTRESPAPTRQAAVEAPATKEPPPAKAAIEAPALKAAPDTPRELPPQDVANTP